MDDLSGAVADHAVGKIVDRALPSLHPDADTAPAQVVAAAIEAIIGWPDEHRNLYRFLRSHRHDTALAQLQAVLAEKAARLFVTTLTRLGVEDDQAQASGYGIAGYLAAAGEWWQQQQDSPSRSSQVPTRQRMTELTTAAVWHLIDRAAVERGRSAGTRGADADAADGQLSG